MKFKSIAAICGPLLLLAACGQTPTNSGNAANNAATTKATETPAPVSTRKPGEVPFEGFSNLPTTAKAGENILCIDARQADEIASSPIADAHAVFYNRKMVTPGEIESEVADGFGKTFKIPNAYIVALPKGAKAKAGDVVFTWWQSGGGMFRGYVTDASNPAEPTVRYLDMSNREDKSDKLKPDSFVVIKSAFQPGSVVAFSGDRADTEAGVVIRESGDKLLIKGFAAKLRVIKKSDAKPIPDKPAFKAGDKLKARFFASFEDATVVSIDDKTGKIVVKKDGSAEEKALDFGDVIKL